ncbi:SIR2 family NAD-dependent protein deacylase [Tumebacillus permanentifrigoris]|uniref:protein acetyllysine N-acetyltransferase n=1 Tax=Tumebacillus permanentifrigoris TaxID=378543 RepID=A0A316DBN6_9BACL|nr:Sir2 family NAD-dependent protein deacetylase [Tumebacillus permanentifrigoris]PWK14410.1 NAD-dependent deacetylase [Tumebacillus permanentifrigoris]
MDAQWRRWAESAQQPVAITGAGISVPSGLPTINRSWRGVPLREIFAAQMFAGDPARFFACYRELMLEWREAVPNPAHRALVRAGVRIITQNLDGLHQVAGSGDVLEVHGNLRELVCQHCQGVYPAHVAETNPLPHCPTCAHLLKPNIVLVGEEVRHIATAADWVGQCDLLLVIGTKLEMAPVRDLPQIARERGVPILACNRRAEEMLPALFA